MVHAGSGIRFPWWAITSDAWLGSIKCRTSKSRLYMQTRIYRPSASSDWPWDVKRGNEHRPAGTICLSSGNFSPTVSALPLSSSSLSPPPLRHF